MAVVKFEYLAPESIEETVRLLAERGKETYVLAGGTDLMVKIRHGLLRPRTIIGLKKIKGLDRITFHKKTGLHLGALVRLADLASHAQVLRKYPAVAYAAQETANPQIRNMGTVVGNICNAAPSADNAPALMALGAEVILVGGEGERRLPLDQFFKGPGLTAIEPGELVIAIRVPLPPPKSGASYQHISARSKVDISAVGVGTMVVMKEAICQEVRIVLGAVAPVPMRAVKTEQLVTGRKLTREAVKKAGIQAAEECRPISDVRASAQYRRRMVAVLTERALTEAKERALRH